MHSGTGLMHSGTDPIVHLQTALQGRSVNMSLCAGIIVLMTRVGKLGESVRDDYLRLLMKKRMASFNGEISFLIIHRICEASTSK